MLLVNYFMIVDRSLEEQWRSYKMRSRWEGQWHLLYDTIEQDKREIPKYW